MCNFEDMKAFPTLLLLFSVIQLSYAQFERFTYGVKAGLSLSNIYGGVFDDTSFRTGGYGGLYLTTDVDRNIDISLEALVSQQGLRRESLVNRSNNQPGQEGVNLTKQETIIRLDYILLPVVGIYKPTDRLKLKFGPQFGYLVNNTISNNISLFEGSINEREVASLEELTKKINLSLIAGFSVDIYEGLYFEARYNFGISGILKDEDSFFSDENFFNSVIHVGLGFDLK